MRVHRLGFVVCLTVAILAGSCARSKSHVTGTIAYKDQPVKAGTVYFIYEQGGQYQSDLKPDGSYQFMDVPPGNVKVLVETETFNPEQKTLSYTMNMKQRQMAPGYSKSTKEYDAFMAKSHGEKKDAPALGPGLSKEKKEALAKVYVKIPKKYTSEKTTPLTYTVESGTQVKDFNLSD
jgi:hypothetical protein